MIGFEQRRTRRQMGILSFIFGERRDEWTPSPERRFADVEPDTEPETGGAIQPHLAGMRFGIVYCDSSGHLSERTIQVRSVERKHGSDYIYAYCESRQSDRTFCVDRIVRAIDLGSGEIIDNTHGYFTPLFDLYVTEVYAKRRDKDFMQVRRLIDSLGDELIVLKLIAEVDGRFGIKERDLLLKYAAVRADEIDLHLSDFDNDVLLRWLKMQRPTESEAEKTISRLSTRRPAALDDIRHVVEIVAEIDGKVTIEEKLAFQAIQLAIGKCKEATRGIAASRQNG